MPSAEEDILLLLLPQMQERLDFIALKPHLKLSCSLTEEECQLLFEHGQNMQGNNIAHVLVDLLREKAPHCCARMFLGALKQHQKNSHNAVSDYSEIIELLHTKLQGIINGEPSHATSEEY